LESIRLVAGKERPSWLATLALVAALIAGGGMAMVGLASFADGFDPPNWVRIASMVPIPFAIVAAVGCGVFGLDTPARRRAILGLVLTGLSIVAFVVMIVMGG